MDDLLWLRVLTAFGVDAGLSVLCGLLLSRWWLGEVGSSHAGVRGRTAFGLRIFAALLLLAGCVQLLLLAISFSGQSSPVAVTSAMPDVCSTHAGAFLLALCVVALALCFVTWIASPQFQQTACAVLVFGALCLHADTGHAASEGHLSLAQVLQLVHLLGMALWSGGVIASGLFAVPRLQRQASREMTRQPALSRESVVSTYLDHLSTASSWAVVTVLLSGVIKAAIATNADLHLIRSTQWGQVLTIKSVFVALTVILGARNRWLLTSRRRQSASSIQSVALTLRVEAISMLAVLLLSAWLANSQPPLE